MAENWKSRVAAYMLEWLLRKRCSTASSSTGRSMCGAWPQPGSSATSTLAPPPM